jgi:hypothetical protein
MSVMAGSTIFKNQMKSLEGATRPGGSVMDDEVQVE